ncbi:MAG: DinB family protein [Alicyclobacillus herbarius]|uniref:DinB family protein n=1 Tax=Alicyclobacillus herbarius TaxID=122960 RepID=UPI00235486B3|nr:DinB family protein [Alicyclobacillus herbarius]MCL6633235.1 DinB family protein [Alicyclobacillus herbarius]
MDSRELMLALLDFRHDHEAGFVPLMAAVEGLTAEQASWRPDVHSHSIWQLVNHITFWNEYILQRMRGLTKAGTEIDNEQTFGDPGNPMDDAAWQQTIERADRVYRELRKAVADANESDLDQAFDDQGTPLKVVLGDIAMHDAYHIGQIMYVRKLQGWKRT